MSVGWILVSPNGVGDVGGVERVMRYLRDLLSASGPVLVLDRSTLIQRWPWASVFCRNRVGDALISPWLYSAYLWIYARKARVISNGFTTCAYPCDIVIFHGTMVGFSHAVQKFVSCNSGFLMMVYASYELLAARLAQRIVAVSEMVKQEVARYYRPQVPIHVIPNGVDISHFRGPTRTARNAQEIAVLFVGRVEPGKGVHILRSIAEIPGCSLHIVTPPCRGVDYFRSFPRVRISIGVPYHDMPSVYQEADIMVMPSCYEGFEMVTLEALACGLPVIGKRVGAVRVLLEESCPGVFELRETGNYAEQIRAAVAAFSDTAQRQRIREHVVARYGLDAFQQRWTAFLT